MKAITNYRYYALIAAYIVCFVGIFAVPQDNLSAFTWMCALVGTKTVGFAAGYLAYRLTEHWDAEGAIPELTNLIKNY